MIRVPENEYEIFAQKSPEADSLIVVRGDRPIIDIVALGHNHGRLRSVGPSLFLWCYCGKLFVECRSHNFFWFWAVELGT